MVCFSISIITEQSNGLFKRDKERKQMHTNKPKTSIRSFKNSGGKIFRRYPKRKAGNALRLAIGRSFIWLSEIG